MIAAALTLALLSAEPLLEPSAARPVYVASVLPLSSLGLGLVVQGERYLADDHWSVAVNLGARDDGWGDYDAFSISLGAQVRRFLWRPGRTSQLPNGERLGGLYAYLQTEAVWRTLSASGRTVGRGVQLLPTLGLGYRFLPVWRVELTPFFGMGPRVELDARPTSQTRISLHASYGLTLGWVL